MIMEEILQGHLINIIQFAIVLSIGVIITRMVSKLVSNFLKKPDMRKIISTMGYDEPIIELILLVMKYVLYFITFIVAIAQFGFATIVFDVLIILITMFIVVLVLFSLKDFVPNASAGIYLNAVKSIRKGDVLKIGHYSGKVVEMDLVSITLQDKDGRLTIIPNANVVKRDIIKEKTKNKK